MEQGCSLRCLEEPGDAGATFDLKQHFWEKGLESTLCCTQAAWARSRELLRLPGRFQSHLPALFVVALDLVLPGPTPSLVFSCQWCPLHSPLWACPVLQHGGAQPWCLLSPWAGSAGVVATPLPSQVCV